MYPEDRVLIAVINRKRDLIHARDNHWYRIPVHQMPHGISTEYIAFFVNGRFFKDKLSAVHYYARVNGVELRYRYELLPDEVEHPRAGEVYYRLAIGDLVPKAPPITNPERRSIAFIYTTWDRFQAADVISDLYSDADHFVERISKKLKANGIPSEQLWDAEQATSDHAPGLRFRCKDGDFYLTHSSENHDLSLDSDEPEDAIFARIKHQIESMGGLIMTNLAPD